MGGLVSLSDKKLQMKLPPSAALRLKSQYPSRLVREGHWLKSKPPVTEGTQSPVEGHTADETKPSVAKTRTTNARRTARSTRTMGLTTKKQPSLLEIDKDNGPGEEETADSLCRLQTIIQCAEHILPLQGANVVSWHGQQRTCRHDSKTTNSWLSPISSQH